MRAFDYLPGTLPDVLFKQVATEKGTVNSHILISISTCLQCILIDTALVYLFCTFFLR